jgi:hypothetical protein
VILNTISVGNGDRDFELEGLVSFFGYNMFSSARDFDPAALQGPHHSPPANLEDLFVSVASGAMDPHLQSSGHAALGTGLTLGGASNHMIDIDGETRGMRWDLGADQTLAAVPPEADCFDGADNDADGLTDCADPDCAGLTGGSCDTGQPGVCAAGTRTCLGGEEICAQNSPSGPEGPPLSASCSDGLDNDCDGAADGADSDCVLPPETDCFDVADNDADGLTDCADPDCAGLTGGSCDTGQPGVCAAGTRTCSGGGEICARNNPSQTEGPPGDSSCTDGLDNDCNGAVDGNDPSCTPPASTSSDYPRLFNMFWHGYIHDYWIPEVAKWDFVSLGTIWTNEQLATLRALNPDIRIYLYVYPYGLGTGAVGTDPWITEAFDYAQDNKLWWYTAKDPDPPCTAGQQFPQDCPPPIGSDWPGAQMVNITSHGYSGPLGTWHEFLAAHIESLMRDRPDVNGVFLDNLWKHGSWQQGTVELDSDCHPDFNPAGCDQVRDDNQTFDAEWNQAMRAFSQDVRQRFDQIEAETGRPLEVLSNGASDYFEFVNGTTYEQFPGISTDYGAPYSYDWRKRMLWGEGSYLVAPFSDIPSKVSVINAYWSGTTDAPNRSPDFERHKRFTFASALLGDGYYSLDRGFSGHGNLWWEPEYDHAGRGTGYLGQPLGPMYSVAPTLTTPALLQDPGFDLDDGSWRRYVRADLGSVARDTSHFASPPASMRLTQTQLDPAPNTLAKLWQNEISLQKDHAYTMRFRAYSDTPVWMKLNLYLSTGVPNWSVYVEPGEWRDFEISFVPSSTVVASLNIFLESLGTLWLDDFALQEGDRSFYRRDFENGIVLLNYTNSSQTHELGGTFDRLDIPGSSVFNGSAVTQETVPPADGRILLRRVP